MLFYSLTSSVIPMLPECLAQFVVPRVNIPKGLTSWCWPDWPMQSFKVKDQSSQGSTRTMITLNFKDSTCRVDGDVMRQQHPYGDKDSFWNRINYSGEMEFSICNFSKISVIFQEERVHWLRCSEIVVCLQTVESCTWA